MATKTSFNNMLKKYMPYKLLWEEVMKRDYFLMKAEKDQKWKGGELQVPFKGGSASSIKYGGLTDVADIVENKYVLGTVVMTFRDMVTLSSHLLKFFLINLKNLLLHLRKLYLLTYLMVHTLLHLTLLLQLQT